jgi:hypothetical protein
MTVTSDDPRWGEFVRRLDAELRDGCDGTNERTVAVLRAMGLDLDEVNDTLAWLGDRGGCCCGCEVMLNVVIPLAGDGAEATP